MSSARDERATHEHGHDARGQRRRAEEHERVRRRCRSRRRDRPPARRDARAVHERAVARAEVDDVRALPAHDEARVSARDAAAHELEIGVGAASEIDRPRDGELDGERVLADEDGRAQRLDVAERRSDVVLGDHRMVASCHDESLHEALRSAAVTTMPPAGARRTRSDRPLFPSLQLGPVQSRSAPFVRSSTVSRAKHAVCVLPDETERPPGFEITEPPAARHGEP